MVARNNYGQRNTGRDKSSLLRKFIQKNKELCKKIERRLPQARGDMSRIHEETVIRHMNSRPNQLVLDVGGGKRCPFAKRRMDGLGTRIIAVDVSEEELQANEDVDQKIVADIVHDFPFLSEEVDIVASRSVMEHLEDIERFVRNSYRALRKGGYFIHLLPSKFAPFALINQAISAEWARGLLHFFHPESKGICGFRATYDNCYYSALTTMLEDNGFEIIDIRCHYYQSDYFNFFLPLYVASATYELVVRATDARNLCSKLLIIAQKR